MPILTTGVGVRFLVSCGSFSDKRWKQGGFFMLVLSRKQTQRIRLGDSIVITVVKVAGDKVRLGIDAPRDMLVLRDELEPHADGHAEIDVPSSPLAGLT